MDKTQTTNKINAMYNLLSKSEKKIATYIKDNKDCIYNMPIKELSKRCDSSEASIMRLTKKIGFDGYKDLKLSLYLEHQSEIDNKEKEDVYAQIDLRDDVKSVMKKLNKLTIDNLNKNEELMDYDALEKAINKIQKTNQSGGKIYLIGCGGSNVITKDFKLKLMRLGIEAIVYENSHLLLESISNSNENDLAIIISTLARSKEIEDFVDILKKNQSEIISITQYNKSNWINSCDINIFTVNVENDLRLGSMTSRIIQLSIVDTIFTYLALSDYENQRKRLDKVQDNFKTKNFYK